MPTEDARAAVSAADLELWLQRRPQGPHEAVISFRPPGSSDVKDLSGTPRPQVELNQTRLLAASHAADAYGEALQQQVFAAPSVMLALNTARNQALGARVPLRIRLRLDADDPLFASLRWETIRDPLGAPSAFLAANAETLLSRYLSSSDPTPVTVGAAGALTALVVGAAPEGLANLPPFDVQQALDDVTPALAGVATKTIAHVSFAGLTRALLDEPAILYLIAHGAIADGEPFIYLEQPQGGAEPVRAADLVQALRNLARRPLLIVLASCRSAGSSNDPRHALVALGPMLASAGVGAVVAMHNDISQETIRQGMPIFFAQLMRHGCVDLAMAAMRSALVAAHSDWWKPVLYLRLDDGRLFTPTAAAAAGPALAPPARVIAAESVRAIEQQQDLLGLVDQKIAHFQREQIIRSDPGVLFQLKQELGSLEAQRARIVEAIARLRSGGAL